MFLAILIGVLVSVPFFMLFLWICKLMDSHNEKRKLEIQEREQQRQLAYQREQERKEMEKAAKAALRMKPHRDLIEQYRNSQLTKEVIDYICGGPLRIVLPTEIIIFDDRIQGTVNGEVRSYVFASHRVYNFDQVIWSGASRDLMYIVRPQMAMAEAINNLLGGVYVIQDGAGIDRNYFTDSNGDLHFQARYVSNSVTMRHVSTQPNRNF